MKNTVSCKLHILTTPNIVFLIFFYRYAIILGSTTEYKSLQDQILLGYEYKVEEKNNQISFKVFELCTDLNALTLSNL